LMRMKETHDGAEPSANSVSALNLSRIAHMLGDPEAGTRAQKTLGALAPALRQNTFSLPLALAALEKYRSPGRQLVIVGKPEDPAARALRETAKAHSDPDTLLVFIGNKEEHEFFASKADFFQALDPEHGQPAAYLCRNFVCELPLTTAEDLLKSLRK